MISKTATSAAFGLYLSLASASACASQEDDRAAARRRMVEEQIEARGIDNPTVLRAMEAVPRHRFVPSLLSSQAYDDHALPIGSRQTISQPYIVALMTALADLSPSDVVLEVGTGSAYQAAVLAEIVRHVFTIEIRPELASSARELLGELGYTNITVARGDGYVGWEEHGPFDAILVTAAPDHVPPALVDQLAPGGALVIPVGPRSQVQELQRITKAEDGTTTTEELLPVVFVPLVR